MPRSSMCAAPKRMALLLPSAALLLALAACNAPPSQGQVAPGPPPVDSPMPAPTPPQLAPDAPTAATPRPPLGQPTQGVMEHGPPLIEDPAGPFPPTQAQAPPMNEAPAPSPGRGNCDAGKAQSAVGKVATQAVIDRVVADSGARTARVIKPGMMVTMDYREDRVNLEVDGANVITRVKCG